MDDREQLKGRLVEAELTQVADRLAQLARPCYRLGRILLPEDQIPVGASKLGGSPDVPAGFSWPHAEGAKAPEAMEFVGQVHLADLPEPLPEALPRDGVLSFFTRWSEGRVLYFPEGAALARTESPNPPAPPAPEGFWAHVRAMFKPAPDPCHTYRSCRLEFSPAVSPPDGGSAFVEELELSEEHSEIYFELCEELWGEAPKHQMLGHASPVQNEMEIECDFERRGEKARWDLPRERLLAAARDWVLLLQVDTDDAAEGPGWMWGDAGMVYFWIHRDDLAARAFDRVVCIPQCH